MLPSGGKHAPVNIAFLLTGPHIPVGRIVGPRSMIMVQFPHLNKNRDRRCPSQEDCMPGWKAGKLFQQAADVVRYQLRDQFLIGIIDDAMK